MGASTPINIKFVVVSKTDTAQLKPEDFNGLLYSVKAEFYYNNTKPLAAIYNAELEKARQEQLTHIAFMHGDVNLDVLHLITHIISCSPKYDVMGLCGTEVASLSQSPLNWFTSSIPSPEKRWGCVTHGEMGNQTTFYSKDRQDVTDHAAALIDGLCIIFGPKALWYSDIKFDEQFYFDQYDTDISLQACIKHNLNVGVLVEPSLQHYSIGRSIQTAQFLVHEIDLRKKWKLDIPADSPIRSLPKEVILYQWKLEGRPLVEFDSVDDLVK